MIYAVYNGKETHNIQQEMYTPMSTSVSHLSKDASFSSLLDKTGTITTNNDQKKEGIKGDEEKRETEKSSVVSIDVNKDKNKGSIEEKGKLREKKEDTSLEQGTRAERKKENKEEDEKIRGLLLASAKKEKIKEILISGRDDVRVQEKEVTTKSLSQADTKKERGKITSEDMVRHQLRHPSSKDVTEDDARPLSFSKELSSQKGEHLGVRTDEAREDSIRDKEARIDEGKSDLQGRVAVKGEWMHRERTHRAKKDKASLRVHEKEGKARGESSAIQSTLDSRFRVLEDSVQRTRILEASSTSSRATSASARQDGSDALIQQAKLVVYESGRGQIKVQLAPKELGEVKLTVFLDSDQTVHARAVVQSEGARDVMNKNLGNLAREFFHEGYEVGDFSVSVESETSSSEERSSTFSRGRHRSMIGSETHENARTYIQMSNWVNFVA